MSVKRTLTASVVSIAALCSCRQILDIQERPLKTAVEDGGVPSGDGGNGAPKATVMSCGGFAQGAKACAACLDRECCDAAKDCEADPTCKPAYACTSDCAPGDAECQAFCIASYARSDNLAKALACASKCDSACGQTCGALRDGANACDACVQQGCCEESSACANNPDCIELRFCYELCLPSQSGTCEQSCKQHHPAGADDYAALAACRSDKCSSDCSSGNAWECLESPRAWRKPPTSEDITFDMTIVDFGDTDEKPYAGLTVKACLSGSPDCHPPIATTTTDDQGHFQLSVPSGNNGFEGYIDLSGPGLYPALYYFEPPLVVSGFRGYLRLPNDKLVGALAGANGVELDPGKGHLAIVPWNCLLSPAKGVSFSVKPDAGATPYYFKGGLPNKDATETDGDGNSSIAGFLNVQPGSALLSARVVKLDRVSGERTLVIRPGTLTTAPIPPTP